MGKKTDRGSSPYAPDHSLFGGKKVSKKGGQCALGSSLDTAGYCTAPMGGRRYHRDVCRKDASEETKRRDCMYNPFTHRWIKKDGQTARDLKSGITEKRRNRVSKTYPTVPKKLFCGPAGGYPEGTYPVNSARRCRAALMLSRYAPNPRGIDRCALDLAREHGWRCGTESEKARKYGLKPSYGRRRRGGLKRTDVLFPGLGISRPGDDSKILGGKKR